MGTRRNGSGTTVRRRTKSAGKQVAATERESNGLLAHNGGDTGSNNELNIESIRVRAYELFRARGATHGRDLADWLQAERELRAARKL
jgi:hypothetical protein